MASATQVPPPPRAPMPPLPPRPPRSLAGPVVLIVIGIFFLLGNIGVIGWRELLRWFAHYWPVLLILWGVIKLVEYQRANRSGVRASGIGAGGVLLVIFLVVTGLIATEAYRLNWNELRDQMHIEGADLPWWGHSYDYNDDMQQAFPAGATLRVQSERGAINVTDSLDNQIHISVHKKINADSQGEADNWNKSTRPLITASGASITVDANTHGSGDHWVSTNLDISVPRKASVVLTTKHGDVSVMGRDGGADVTSQHGEVAITDLSGALILNLSHSSARVLQIGSDVTIQGRANDVSVEDVKGAVRLNGDFMESVKLARIAKGVSFKSSRTDMDFTQLEGSLNLDSGDLEADGVNGPVRLRTRSKDIRLNGTSSDLHLENENGAIEVHVNKMGSMEIKNSRGDIRVFLPEKAGFQVEAQARDGEIRSDFSELKIDNGDNRASANGSINGGASHLVLNVEHGTIELLRGVAMPIPPAPKTPKAPPSPNLPHPTEN